MIKRFSTKAFILTMLVHFLVTWLLYWFSEYSYAEWMRGGAHVDSVWVRLVPWTGWIGWIVQPVAMYARDHALPWAHSTSAFDRPSATNYILPWIVFVGLCVGFLAPRFSRWRRGSSNQAMERTAGSFGS